jgi:hypothetical protein
MFKNARGKWIADEMQSLDSDSDVMCDSHADGLPTRAKGLPNKGRVRTDLWKRLPFNQGRGGMQNQVPGNMRVARH